MTTIKLWNSAARGKVEFAPLDPANVRMYVCGPTVYDRAHIGNARPAVVFDVLFRLLRHVYGEDHVTYVRNITDIEDKIMDRAKERGVSIAEITAETTRWYQEDMAALGSLPPTHQPRATEFVPQMVAMIETLVAKGHAYEAQGHVLFEVANYPEYGKLSGRSTDDMIAGARVEVAPFKRDPMDFVLWKPSAPDQPGWDSPWGRGRPGWHIECSAMAGELLGETFDIHGGGADLMFPHHENEIAQSRCACPEGGFAKLWMHNGMINVDGRKMSKSLGNFLTVEDLRDQAPGEVLRLALLSTHYRGVLDWTEQRVSEARDALAKWGPLVEGVSPGEAPAVLEALMDDLNTPAAFAEMHRMARAGEVEALAGAMALMGIDAAAFALEDIAPLAKAKLARVLRISDLAKKKGNIDIADMIRDRLHENGVTVKDVGGGKYDLSYDMFFAASLFNRLSDEERDQLYGNWRINRSGASIRHPRMALGMVSYAVGIVEEIMEVFSDEIEELESETKDKGDEQRGAELDEQLVEALLARRAEARAARDFAAADMIRKGLDEAGIVVIDQKGGPSEWRPGPDFDPAKLEALR